MQLLGRKLSHCESIWHVRAQLAAWTTKHYKVIGTGSFAQHCDRVQVGDNGFRQGGECERIGDCSRFSGASHRDVDGRFLTRVDGRLKGTNLSVN